MKLSIRVPLLPKDQIFLKMLRATWSFEMFVSETDVTNAGQISSTYCINTTCITIFLYTPGYSIEIVVVYN